ncbi:MAG: carbohydrate ABC transporter permease [Oscillospiraceae bacterium]|jgi:multiple sugar transport system permease protein|nr:carbohydrate ABC transporter permease [Oscillospiraceae bacterium]
MVAGGVKPIRRVLTPKLRRAALYHVLMASGSFVMLYPLVWMISSSVKPNGDIFTTATRLFPSVVTGEHYATGWRGFAGYTFAVFFGNSLLIAALSMMGTVVSSAVVAFGFARIRFPGRNVWFVVMITTMLLPSQVMMIPRFVLFNRMGWVGTYLPMTVPAFFGGAFSIFLVMQFIRSIPRDMDEAAKIDGCSWYGIFLKIVAPMIVPALVTVGVLAFIGSWEDFMGALLYLNKPNRYTAAYALKLFNDNTKIDYGATFAMSVLSLAPILAVFFFFQKNLVEGISIQGLKG